MPDEHGFDAWTFSRGLRLDGRCDVRAKQELVADNQYRRHLDCKTITPTVPQKRHRRIAPGPCASTRAWRQRPLAAQGAPPPLQGTQIRDHSAPARRCLTRADTTLLSSEAGDGASQ